MGVDFKRSSLPFAANPPYIRDMITKDTILDALSEILPREEITGVVIRKEQKSVGFAIEVNPDEAQTKEPLRQLAQSTIEALAPDYKVTVVLTAHSDAPKMSDDRKQLVKRDGRSIEAKKDKINPLSNVRHIIAIASGKGGVGKSTTSVNLALALKHIGLKVGLLDADIFGPSIPTMLNIHKNPAINDDKLLIPLERFGLQVMSMGFMVEEGAPIVWRGPMVISAIRQMLEGVQWGYNKNDDDTPLDVLVVDMPPGTGDAQLTMSQRAPLSGAVIVTTPQDIATLDAAKGLKMFQKVNVPILGLIENMSWFEDPASGEKHYIFGRDGGAKEAEEHDVDLLAQIPLVPELRQTSDAGKPLVALKPEHEISDIYIRTAKAIWDKVDSGAPKKTA